MTLPPWIKQKAPNPAVLSQMREILDTLNLHTVCESAHCPNMGECFTKGTATVMIMGDRCTRNCGFCAVESNAPKPLDPAEPAHVAAMAVKLNLKHIVITSVTRDDLEDGGAHHFAQTVQAVRQATPSTTIEILVPDFQGNQTSIKTISAARPDIINHNLETVPSLYQKVRPQAKYERSLALLKAIKELDKSIYTKSGIMVGLGETFGEVITLMKDLRQAECDILTIGQYLRPSPLHLEIAAFIPPEVFNEYKEMGEKLGFKYVASAPLVRSSYHAEDFFPVLQS
jgi:lipoyl synthase